MGHRGDCLANGMKYYISVRVGVKLRGIGEVDSGDYASCLIFSKLVAIFPKSCNIFTKIVHVYTKKQSSQKKDNI